ncbi:hypothetical protein X12_001622 [Xanthomonas arboricola]|uniref:hypothetical protein n=1 Tax=Xanthomonas arboricola TaxID=56448 RepID=UPI00069D1DC7|nr:hypothetical protein [Xanthomonas arboricola]KOB03646.1 hypothetical protein AE921_03020 [Xanthomonas arboricola]KOB07028.1 hypothetical protein AE923_14835 [Xanthomonas arboricola]KOB09543.1 hypothetical protein AE922_06640 [Xanthomonas arboricola]KOB20616.1 hypothetical protein AE925_01930 [Xanthomonas arboricola]KOB23440.1 hypothetical protein AE926_10135 [Xanthomonas arboricola]
MKISNNHKTPLALPDGTEIIPGSPATVPNWPAIKKNAVVQAWLAANILSESEDDTAPFLLGTFNLPDSILLIEGGESVTRDDVVQHAFKASALALEDWNSLDEVDREARISASLDALKAEAAAAAQAVIDAKVAADQKKVDLIAKLQAGGINHDKRWGVDKLQAALDEAEKSKTGS